MAVRKMILSGSRANKLSFSFQDPQQFILLSSLFRYNINILFVYLKIFLLAGVQKGETQKGRKTCPLAHSPRDLI